MLSEQAGRSLRAVVEGRQDLQEIVIEEFTGAAGRRRLEGPAVAAFRQELLSGGVPAPGGERRRFAGKLAGLAAGSEIRVIVQDVTGRRVSSTIRISP